MRKRLSFVVLLAACIIDVQAADTSSVFAASIDPLLSKHCIDCHGTKKQKGDVRLDTLSRNLSDPKVAIQWRDVMDVLRKGEMPPDDKPRPPLVEINKLIDAIDRELLATAAKSAGRPRYAIRRLSHTALDNSVLDLLDVEIPLSFDLPRDTEVAGFDNQAQTMSLSPELLNQLQINARRISSFALVDGPNPMSSVSFSGKTIITGGTLTPVVDGIPAMFSNRTVGSNLWPRQFKASRPGYYDITIKAYSYDNREEIFKKHKDYKLVNGTEANLKRKKLTDTEPRIALLLASTFTEEGSNKPGGTPSLAPRLVGRIEVARKLNDHVVRIYLNEGENFTLNYTSAPSYVSQALPIIQVGKERITVGEAMYLHQITIKGPIINQWPPKGHVALLGESDVAVSDSEAQNRIRNFLPIVFRRPVSENTASIYTALFSTERKAGKSAVESMRSVVEAILCSPRYLFTYDDVTDESYDIASRLSYFLWNSTPDVALLDLAKSKRLKEKSVIAEQVKRMLVDPKARRFTDDFVGQWLETRKVGRMAPDPKLYPSYDIELENAIREEPAAFFAEVLKRNLSAKSFIDSDFLMLNERLAEHYGIKGIKGDKFLPVTNSLPDQRGGIMGHASMQLITSNGSRTSPVVRGVWMLENVLASPPAPPPPDIEPLEPDVRGTKTIREMLAKHREVETCADCHRKIDPLGFAMENFDAIGAWRTGYSIKGKSQKDLPVIDVSGQLPNGTKVNGFQELKKALGDKPDQVMHAIAEKLLVHAMGRPLGIIERSELDRVVHEAKKYDYRLVDFIASLCVTDIFISGGK